METQDDLNEELQNQPSKKEKPAPLKFRLFANSEETYRVIRPAVSAFEKIRKLALHSTKIPLSRKFDICKELAVDWKVVLTLENRKELDKILEQVKTDDPAMLGDKILAARGIKGRHSDKSITPFELAVKVVPVLFTDDAGNPPSISKESEDELLVGNIEQALGVFLDQININEEEDLSSRGTFKAFTNSDQEYPLASVSVGNMRRLNELQVASACISEKERREICEEMKWNYGTLTPEKITDMKSKITYWIEASQIVLKGVELTDTNKGNIDAGEINRALAVFFAKSDGLF